MGWDHTPYTVTTTRAPAGPAVLKVPCNRCFGICTCRSCVENNALTAERGHVWQELKKDLSSPLPYSCKGFSKDSVVCRESGIKKGKEELCI